MTFHLLAQLTNPVLPATLGGGAHPNQSQGGASVGLLISNLIGAIFIFAFILAFFFLITGGISWITGAGEKGKLEEARNKITHALIGLLVVGAAWAIMKVIGGFFGINLQAITLPSFK